MGDCTPGALEKTQFFFFIFFSLETPRLSTAVGESYCR